jgi:hypothetical protein
MNNLHERYVDLLAGSDDVEVERLVEHLDRFSRYVDLDLVPVAVDTRVRIALLEAAAASKSTTKRGEAARSSGSIVRWLSVAGVAVTAMALAAMQLWPSPGPVGVSAQTILRRAETPLFRTNRTIQLRYHVVVTAPYGTTPKASGLAQVSTRLNGSGLPGISSQILALTKTGQLTRSVAAHYVQLGNRVYGYDARQGEFTIGVPAQDVPSWLLPNIVFDGPAMARFLAAPRNIGPTIRRINKVPHLVGGAPIEGVTATHWPGRPGLQITFYFDSHSYVLRGFDAQGLSSAVGMPAWHVRLLESSIISGRPQSDFTLQPRAGTRITLASTLVSELARICGQSAQRLKMRLRSLHESPLEACSPARHLSARDLVIVLSRSDQLGLRVAVQSRLLSNREARVLLANERSELLAWINRAAE